jgi:hypothetical protein
MAAEELLDLGISHPVEIISTAICPIMNPSRRT